MNIVIRPIKKGDLGRVKEFQKFVNSFIEEDAPVLMNKKVSLKEEEDYIKKSLNEQKKKNLVHMIVECDGKIAGSSRIVLGKWRARHVGDFGIMIHSDYRGMGIGTKLMTEIIRFSKEYLKELRVINLLVFDDNKIAIGLYKKMGFKKIAKIPKQRIYKGKLLDEFLMVKVL